jgi:hypothetical protein
MPDTDPVVPVFPAGYGPVPNDFNTWVQGPFTFLAAKVMLRAELQAAQALTANASTLVQFGSTGGDILEDPYGGWSTTATGSQPAWSWLCPAGCTGWYEFTMTAFTANPGSSTDAVQAILYVDGAEYAVTSCIWGDNGHATGGCGAVTVPLIGGVDYVQGFIYSTAGVSTTATAGQLPTLEACWVST